MNGRKVALLEGLGSVADLFDGFILDVWGTVYNGGIVFPGVIDTLKYLRSLDKRLIFLSNAPQIPDVVADRLRRLGITSDLYDGIVTSGSETLRMLTEGSEPELKPFKGTVHEFAPDRCPHILPKGKFAKTDRIEKADWILNAAPNRQEEQVVDYRDRMETGIAHGLPMLCANPDRVVVHGTQKLICAGALAEWYSDHGGYVLEVGKPNAPIFERCRAMLNIEETSRIAMVGDNLATDILGANRAGIPAILIASGIHDLVNEDGTVEQGVLAALEIEYKSWADMVLPMLAR